MEYCYKQHFYHQRISYNFLLELYFLKVTNEGYRKVWRVGGTIYMRGILLQILLTKIGKWLSQNNRT